MSESTASTPPTHPFIESDRVEGTSVYSLDGDHIGTIKRLVIEKVSGQVMYAVTSLGKYFNLEHEEHTIPWKRLRYDTTHNRYVTDITGDELRSAPEFTREDILGHSTQAREELDSHYGFLID
jgi:sporulation protein YlmC with PRC-barrel domain